MQKSPAMSPSVGCALIAKSLSSASVLLCSQGAVARVCRSLTLPGISHLNVNQCDVNLENLSRQETPDSVARNMKKRFQVILQFSFMKISLEDHVKDLLDRFSVEAAVQDLKLRSLLKLSTRYL